mgnify:CR=1 FL=1
MELIGRNNHNIIFLMKNRENDLHLSLKIAFFYY